MKSGAYLGLHNAQDIENQFFTSFHNFCSLYKLKYPKKSSETYPNNILSAFNWAKKQVEDRNLKLVILQNETNIATLSTITQFDFSHTLYYIPVEPLNRLLENKSKKQTADLLLSVFSYLVKIQRIPIYTDTNCYMYYLYERMETQMIEDGEYEDELINDNDPLTSQQSEQNEWFTHRLGHFEYISKAGWKLFKQINHESHLLKFKTRLEKYKPISQIEHSVATCAKFAFDLYTKYPNRSFFDGIDTDFNSCDDENHILRRSEYLSFFWSETDCLYDELWDWVNCEFQESCQAELPVSYQYFGNPQINESHDFQFENDCLELFNQLSDALRTVNK